MYSRLRVDRIFMKTKKIIVNSVIVVIILICVYLYKNSPPYLYLSRLHFFLHRDDYDVLLKEMNAYPNVSYFELNYNGIDVKVAERNEDKIINKRRRHFLKKYSIKLNVSPLWRSGSVVYFYIGADIKHGKNYQIAYAASDDYFPTDMVCNSDNYKKDHWSCFVPIDRNWAIHYQW